MIRFWFFFFIIFIISSCSNPSKKEKQKPFILKEWNKELKRLEAHVNSLENDFSKTLYLRNYCSKIADYGPMTEASHAYFKEQTWDDASAADVYHTFKTDSLAAYCEPISAFYCYLLNHFEIPCATYGHGITLDLSHVLALVEIETEQGKQIVIQDPHYALTYIDKNGKLLDFTTLIQHVKSGNFKYIDTAADYIHTKIIFEPETLQDLKEQMPNDSCRILLDEMKNEKLVAGNFVYPAARNYQFMVDNSCNSFKNKIEEYFSSKGMPSNINHNFLFKRHVGGTHKSYFEPKIDEILR